MGTSSQGLIQAVETMHAKHPSILLANHQKGDVPKIPCISTLQKAALWFVLVIEEEHQEAQTRPELLNLLCYSHKAHA